jgi:hypothetical protein
MSLLTTRIRSAPLLLILVLLLGAASPAPPKAPPDWFWGCWTVKKLLPVTDSSGLSPKQEEAIIGRKLVFAPRCARSGRIAVQSPKYSVKILSARDFFKLGYFPLSQIGVRKSYVAEVDLALPGNLSDLDFPGNNVYLREKDIVIEVEGDYFIAERATPNDPACRCGYVKAK